MVKNITKNRIALPLCRHTLRLLRNPFVLVSPLSHVGVAEFDQNRQKKMKKRPKIGSISTKNYPTVMSHFCFCFFTSISFSFSWSSNDVDYAIVNVAMSAVRSAPHIDDFTCGAEEVYTWCRPTFYPHTQPTNHYTFYDNMGSS